jgi:hypothetical protein
VYASDHGVFHGNQVAHNSTSADCGFIFTGDRWVQAYGNILTLDCGATSQDGVRFHNTSFSSEADNIFVAPNYNPTYNTVVGLRDQPGSFDNNPSTYDNIASQNDTFTNKISMAGIVSNAGYTIPIFCATPSASYAPGDSCNMHNIDITGGSITGSNGIQVAGVTVTCDQPNGVTGGLYQINVSNLTIFGIGNGVVFQNGGSTCGDSSVTGTNIRFASFSSGLGTVDNPIQISGAWNGITVAGNHFEYCTPMWLPVAGAGCVLVTGGATIRDGGNIGPLGVTYFNNTSTAGGATGPQFFNGAPSSALCTAATIGSWGIRTDSGAASGSNLYRCINVSGTPTWVAS